MSRRTLHMAQILWPAFLIAGVLEMVMFSWVDPGLLHLGDWQPDALTAYSLAVLVFWALVALASGISHWLMSAQASVDPQPHPQAQA